MIPTLAIVVALTDSTPFGMSSRDAVIALTALIALELAKYAIAVAAFFAWRTPAVTA